MKSAKNLIMAIRMVFGLPLIILTVVFSVIAVVFGSTGQVVMGYDSFKRLLEAVDKTIWRTR